MNISVGLIGEIFYELVKGSRGPSYKWLGVLNPVWGFDITIVRC